MELLSADFDDVDASADEGSFDLAVACWTAINKCKADAEVSMGREIEALTIAAHPDTLSGLAPVLGDVLRAARAANHRLTERTELDAGVFEISDVTFAERPEA